MKKITRILSILIAAIITLSTLGITAFAESIEDTAKKIESGKVYSTKLYNDGDCADYKIVASKAGDLKIDLTVNLYEFEVLVYDSNGNKISVSERNLKSGKQYRGPSGGYSETKYNWNSTLEKFSGSLIYGVKKGTYYIRVQRAYTLSSRGSGKLNFTATFPSSSSTKTAKISYLSIEIPKGTAMQLGAVLSAKSNTTVTWSTSKSSVVSVTSKGKITAKKKGSAVITAKLGSSTMKIKIKVT